MAGIFGSSGDDILTGTADDDVLMGDPQTAAKTVLVSSRADGTPGNQSSGRGVFSPDGRYVAFTSSSTNLHPDATQGFLRIFIKDVLTGDVRVVPYVGTHNDSPAFSPDGSKLYFTSGNFDPNPPPTSTDPLLLAVYSYDLSTGEVTNVTTPADRTVAVFDLSSDGTKILFTTLSSNLVAGDTNNERDVFVKDLLTGVTTRVSTDADGGQLGFGASNAKFSADGNNVIFSSYATELFTPDQVPGINIYIKNLATGAIVEVSTNASGVSADLACDNGQMSPDGTKVIFASTATNLVPEVTTFNVTHLYMKDLVTGQVTLLSKDTAGNPLSGSSSSAQFSPDSASVAFTVNDTAGNYKSYIKDLATGALTTLPNVPASSFVVFSDFAPAGKGYSFYANLGGQSQSFAYRAAELGSGRDVHDGGDGFDLASYERATQAVTVDLRDVSGNANRGDALGDTYISIEGTILSSFADTFFGDASNNVIVGLGGGDSIDGGGGDHDLLLFLGAKTGVNANLALGRGFGGDALGDTYVNVEDIYGTDFTDTLTGNAGANILNGGGGVDRLAGGDGDDTYYVDVAGDTVRETNVRPEGGVDTVYFTGTTGTFTLSSAVEILVLGGDAAINGKGNATANEIYGNGAANTLDGARGADHLEGGDGSDTYHVDNVFDAVVEAAGSAAGTADRIISTISFTNAAHVETLALAGQSSINATGLDTQADRLIGNDRANILSGLGGDDVLDGGRGKDVLIGGAGRDTFMFTTAPNTSVNFDVIQDFVAGEDTIALDNAIFNQLRGTSGIPGTTGALDTGQFGMAATADADDRVIYDSATGILTYDINGSAAGGSTVVAKLAIGLALTAADFEVI
jgi:trimeric autotransporter adhesin